VALNVGDAVLIDASITNTVVGSLADPSSLAFTVNSPADVSTDYIYGVASEVTRLSLGEYRLRLELAESGTYRFRITTDTPNAVEDGSLFVSPPSF
jgi:hypothetical protein